METEVLRTMKSFVIENKIRIECEYADYNPQIEEDSEWAKSAYHWKCTLKRPGKRFTVYFSMGRLRAGEPTTEEVLDSLKLDFCTIRDRNFEEWAKDLGYNEDSIKAYKSYLCSKKLSARFCKFLGEQLLEEIQFCEDL